MMCRVKVTAFGCIFVLAVAAAYVGDYGPLVAGLLLGAVAYMGVRLAGKGGVVS